MKFLVFFLIFFSSTQTFTLNSTLKSQKINLKFISNEIQIRKYHFINSKNEFAIIKKQLNVNELEGVLKKESYIAFRKNIFSHLFLDCYLQKINIKNSGIEQVSEYRIGGGLGYCF